MTNSTFIKRIALILGNSENSDVEFKRAEVHSDSLAKEIAAECANQKYSALFIVRL